MPANNSVYLRGTLLEDPYLETLPNGTPFLRFQLAVQRDPSQLSQNAKAPARDGFDVLRIVRFGIQARIDYFYLQQDSAVVVMGWNQSRPVTEQRNGREIRRTLVEVNAQWIAYERNCNFERGDRQRQEILGAIGDRRNPMRAGSDPEVNEPGQPAGAYPDGD